MDKLRIKVRCKEVDLEKEVMLSINDSFPESLGFIPPLGTTLTFRGFKNPEWNGVYKVVNFDGNINVETSRKYRGEAVVEFIPNYTVDLKKIG